MDTKKPWKSYKEQLSILESRGLNIGDREKALDYLERIGYYRLSGYWYPFRKNDPNNHREKIDDFKAESYFEDAVDLYVFDKRLRLLALDALERIELALRVDISHFLGKKDVCAHENPNLFHGRFSKHVMKRSGKTAHQIWLEKFDGQIKNHKRQKSSSILHYENKYGGIPIWVASEVWDFGALSHLFSGLTLSDQQEIAQKYGGIASSAVASRHMTRLAQWIRSLNFIRNASAHHSRMWNINIVDMSASIQKDRYWQNVNPSRSFFYFCIMRKMLNVICPNSSWGSRFMELIDQFPIPKNQSISLFGMGVNRSELLDDWDLWK